ncbi:unnamed protein product [Victoria cruziana]
MSSQSQSSCSFSADEDGGLLKIS